MVNRPRASIGLEVHFQRDVDFNFNFNFNFLKKSVEERNAQKLCYKMGPIWICIDMVDVKMGLYGDIG